MISTTDPFVILIVLTATLAWLNEVVLRLPLTIGLLVMGLTASLVVIALELVFPQISFSDRLVAAVRQIDFQRTLLDGMLAFLLFAGALHVDLSLLKRRTWPIALMATAGVVLSTAVVGLGFWAISEMVGLGLTLTWALVFGALISPTDPVAVVSTLKRIDVPPVLETDMAGESLFNDGVGIVVFTLMLAFATGGVQDAAIVRQVAKLFFVEALGGGLLGLATGYLAYRAIRRIDNYPIETLISLALVAGTYTVAARLHVSGPIAVVVAGILVGNRGPLDAMSDRTQRYLFSFWTLLDEMLNSVLFLLIGLEVLILQFDLSYAWVIVFSIPLALVGRFAAVGLPVLALRSHCDFVPGTVALLTWGGLRGGISVALALSLPEVPHKPVILAATYAVSVFTIVVQGMSLQPLARRALRSGR